VNSTESYDQCNVRCWHVGKTSSQTLQCWTVPIISHVFIPIDSHSKNRRHCLVMLNRVPRMSKLYRVIQTSCNVGLRLNTL